MSLNRKTLIICLMSAFLSGTGELMAMAESNAEASAELFLKKKDSKESTKDSKKSKKSKKSKGEEAPPPSAYKLMTGRDSVAMSGVMNVVQKG